ncbi:MAG: universal stress protein [Halobacteriota archaeon]
MTVLVAVDDDEDQTRLLEEAATLADAFEEELTVLHVLSQSKFRQMEQQTVESTGQTIDLDEIRAFAKELADERAAAVLDAYTAVGMVGTPEDEIVDYAERNDVSYIVVGSRKRSPAGKALFGSVTQSILLNSEIPVLAVRAGSR